MQALINTVIPKTLYIVVNLRMQKQSWFILLAIILTLISCKQNAKTTTYAPTAQDTIPIFPVTDYLLGQIGEIEKSPVTPLLISKQNDRVDSQWKTREQIREFAAPFLTPLIDSASLQKYYTGKSFLDQTINAYTFTYDAKQNIPDSISLREMNVYVNPGTKQVDRLYLVKNTGDTTLQLSWKAGKWFSIRSIIQMADSAKVSEKILKWNFDDTGNNSQ